MVFPKDKNVIRFCLKSKSLNFLDIWVNANNI